MFSRALKDKIFLIGKEKKDVDGYNADWTHFDYMLAAHSNEFRMVRGRDFLTQLRMFWSVLWEYLGPVVNKFENLTKDYNFLLEENQLIINKLAKIKIKHDLFEEYVKTQMSPQEQTRWRHWFKAENKKIEDKIEKIKSDNAELVKEENRIKEEAYAKGYIR